MTELDMIRRAQMYMEKLSHGINPLDGTPVADGDLIRNGRMSRCFAFVAEVLDKVVTNSAPHAEKPQPAAPNASTAAMPSAISFFFIALPLFFIGDRRFSQRNSCLLLSR